MWPIKLDMTRDECRGVLRRLELESYSSVMSTFRAQGGLCKEKARILDELRKLLHISQDRHKAESRRVANDERLTTVAEIISGPNSVQDWCREGRRSFPILPRTAPYTALTYIANTVCEQISRENAKLPHPFETSQHRLEKEQEEEKRKVLEQQKQQDQQMAQTPLKPEAEPTVASPIPTPEPAKLTPPPLVVSMDPFVEAANKSYINNDLKRSYPVDPSPTTPSIVNFIEDDSPLKKKPQLYQELQKQEPSYHPPPIVTFHTQPYTPPVQVQQQVQLQFPLPQQPLSPHKALLSPNNFGPVPINNNNNNNNNNVNAKPPKGSNKSTERQRKTSGSSKKNQNKTKTPYQTSKQSAKAAKNMTQQQLQQPVPIQAKVTGGAKGNSVGSPHLIHSYASPLLPYEIPQQQSGGTEAIQEPLQLQKHLTSNIVYQTQHSAQQQQQSYGVMPGAPHQPLIGSYNVQQPHGQPNANLPANAVYGQQNQILPSSKKDIQYNLTKLNPTNNIPVKNNVNIQLKSSSPSLMPGKGHPLLNYQKKSPSKNVLIPTSSAAATLASLGIPKSIHRKDTTGKFRENDPIINPADIPNPKIIFSTSAPISHHESTSHITPGNQITILDQITLHPPNTIIQTSTSGGVTIIPPTSQHASLTTHIAPNPPTLITNTMALSVPISKPITTPVTPVTNKVVTLKGPNLAGFTPVKSGSKLSVHKLQLMPIGPPGAKNNVIVLPVKSATSGTLNPGQKITIPKSVVDTNALSAANILSPPKVIVQQQPDLNNIVVFDIASDQKLKTTLQQKPPPANKPVITEDTPVDIVSTPLDVVTGAVKLQELSKGFLSPASSSASGSIASPLTEKMVKPQQSQSTPQVAISKYHSNNSANVTKATKFEADSTAPGPSVTVTKKTKANHQGKAAASTSAATVQNSKTKTKPTAAAASSTTAAVDPAKTRSSTMSSTDWELELDQANQVHNRKSNNVIPSTVQKPASKSNPAAQPVAIAPKPVVTAPNSTVRKTSQPLSSSSISSTSTPVVETPVPSDTTRLPIHRPVAPAPTVPTTPTNTVTPTSKAAPPHPPLITTSPPNERSDDTSATDSADAEEDPEVEEEEDCPEAIEEEMIIDEEHFNEVIEEDPDPDEAFNEQEIHGERVEIVSVGYDTSRALIADLEGAESGSPVLVQEGAIVYGKAGNTGVDPSSMNFEQYIEADADGDGASSEVLSRTTMVPAVGGSGSSSNNIMFEMMEIDADGNKHTRTLSYEQALAEGQFVAAEESVKSTGSTSGSGTVKGKTKPTP
ncbi:BRCA2-interacting transcriptional repressor EMSY [Ochlerotatus camptorhynchus]|uniref:BRCA2-interacting transcriptional repressor EMSY n=1 Tax=Ochlerotatus camptorhynchus TaxID=644619 RepID=UPI0031D84997